MPSSKRPLHISEDQKSGMKGNSGIDENHVDAIGVESTDSHRDDVSDREDDDILPVPSLYQQSRNSSLSRSKSVGSFDFIQPSVYDDDCLSGAKFRTGSNAMPRSKRFAAGIKPQSPPARPLGAGMRRSVSMSCIQKSRSDYNHLVGEALANSPKKEIVSTAEDMAIVEKLLSEL
jgi:hypothetical protein